MKIDIINIAPTFQNTRNANQIRSTVLPACVTLFFYACMLAIINQPMGYHILAGDVYTHPEAPIPIMRGAGYDGQFYYALAVDPSGHSPLVNFDSLHYRQQRIIYPLLARLLALGHIEAIPYTMIAVNLIGLFVIAMMGGILAQRAGKNAWWGLLFAVNFGMWFSLARDLTEITALAFCLSALVALPRSKRFSMVLLCLALLSRETNLLLAISILIVAFWQRWRGWQIFLLTVFVYVLWQIILSINWGSGIGGYNIGLPLVGFISFARDIYSRSPGDVNQIFLFPIAAFGLICLIALRASAAPLYVRLGWILESALYFSLTRDIWLEPYSYLRVGLDWYTLGLIILLNFKIPTFKKINRPFFFDA